MRDASTKSLHPVISTAFCVAAALAFAWCASTADANDRQGWRDRWERMRIDLRSFDPAKDLNYRFQDRSGGTVVTLKSALPTRQQRDIEVEWFFTYISDSELGAKPTRHISRATATWVRNLRRHGIDNLRLERTPVSHIPGLRGGLSAHRRRHQELALAHAPLNEHPGHWVHSTLLETLSGPKGARSIRTRRQAARLLDRAKRLDSEHYLEVSGSQALNAKMREADKRLDQILREASKTHPEALLSPHDPIFLVNGRHLVMGAITGSLHRTYDVLNAVVADELGDRWTAEHAQRTAALLDERDDLRTEGLRDGRDVVYQYTTHADPERAITLDPPFATDPDILTIEWFFTFETEAGRLLEYPVYQWWATVPKPRTLVYSPVGDPRVSGENAARRHQEIMVAGGAVHWEATLQRTLLNRFMSFRSTQIESEADLAALLDEIGMPRADYDAGLAHPDTQARLADINAKHARIREAAGDLTAADPVVVVNGRHLLIGSRFRSLRSLIHTGNVLIERDREAAR